MTIDYSLIRSFIISTETKGAGEAKRTCYRIRYRDSNGKMRRIPPDLVKPFDSKLDAQAWVKSKEALVVGLKAQEEKIRQENNKYPELTDKLNLFINYKLKRQVKDILTVKSYLERYVFNWYVQRGEVNIPLWSNHHEALITHLQSVESIKFKKKLSEETIRKIVYYLNDFYNYLMGRNLASGLLMLEMPVSKSSNRLTADQSYWPREELDKVVMNSSIASDDLKDLCLFLFLTGLRVNEALGVSRLNVIGGSLPVIQSHLDRYGIKNVGYITIIGQLDTIGSRSFSLKPFKSKSEMTQNDYRYIPMTTELLELIQNRLKRLGITPFDPLTSNEDHPLNLLFNGIQSHKLVPRLKELCVLGGIPPRGFHSFRHTFTTNMMIQTQLDFNLVSKFTGHSSQKVLERYNQLVGNMYNEKSRDQNRIKL